MGRGISKLQGWILGQALAGERCAEPLVCSTIKAEYYGLVRINSTRRLSGWSFERRNLKNYNAVSAAISKAMRRLKDRGLITIVRNDMSQSLSETLYRTTIRLTREGWAVAQTLSDPQAKKQYLAKKAALAALAISLHNL